MTDKILCACINCLKDTNGQGKLVTRKTHSIHMKIEKEYSDPDHVPLIAFILENMRISSSFSRVQSDLEKILTEIGQSTESSEPMEIKVPEQSAGSSEQQHLSEDDPIDSDDEDNISPELSEEGSENVPEDDPMDSDDEDDISPKLLEEGSEDEFNMMEGGSEEEFNLPEEREYPSDLGNFNFFLFLFIPENFLYKIFSRFYTELSEEMIKGLRLLKIKDQHNISEAAFNEILEVMEIPRITLYKLRNFLGKQVPIEPNLVDCCVNSCVAFTGENTNKDRCLTCNEERYKNREKLSEGRKKAAYWSVINSLQMQYNDKKRAQLLWYRNEYINTDDYSAEYKIGDVFDGLRYKNLARTSFFANRRDVALLGSTDGFQLF